MSPDDPTPIDLFALGPALDGAHFDALVDQALQASATELERRRTRPTLALVVVQWRRPVLSLVGLAAAAAVALTVVPARSPRASLGAATVATAGAAFSDSASVAEWLGVPSAYASMVEGRSRTVTRSTP